MPAATTIRMVIYAKDIMLILGKNERTARRILKKIRKEFNKKPNAYISVEEFCYYTGLSVEKIIPYLR